MYACLLWNLYTHTNDRLCGSESWKSLNSGKEIYIVKTFDDIKCIYGPYAFFQIFQSPTADSKENNIIKHVLLRGLKPAIVVRSFQNLSNFLQLRTCRKSYCLLPASALLRTAFRSGNARESSSFIFGFPIVWRSCFRINPEPTGGLLLLTNKMAVNGTKPAESLRHLACSLAALNPAPWEKVRSEIFRKTMYSLLTLGTKWSEMCWNYFEYSREGSETSAYMYVYLGMRTRISAQNFYVIGSTTWR